MRPATKALSILCLGIPVGFAQPVDGAEQPAFHTALLHPKPMAAMQAVPPVPTRVAAPVLAEWLSQEERDHPLVGKVWSRTAADFVDPNAMYGALGGGDFILLGETHDNPDHHRIQAAGLAAASGAQKGLAVVFEMITTDQAKGLATFRAEEAAECCRPDSATRFFDLVAWDKTGWPGRDIYRPLIEQMVGHRLHPLAGSDNRTKVRTLGRKGFGALDTTTRERLHLEKPLEPALKEDLKATLNAGHCNLLPASALPAMASVQRYRDAFMAAKLVEGAADTNAAGAVLIAGNEHVRKDRGVPWYLERMAPQKRIVILTIAEVVKANRMPRPTFRVALMARPQPTLWSSPPKPPAKTSARYCANTSASPSRQNSIGSNADSTPQPVAKRNSAGACRWAAPACKLSFGKSC